MQSMLGEAMTPEERAEVDRLGIEVAELRARLVDQEELGKHQAAIAIVLYNGLDQAARLALSVTKGMVENIIAQGIGDAQRGSDATVEMMKDMNGMRDVLADLHNRLEPLHGYLAEAARPPEAEPGVDAPDNP